MKTTASDAAAFFTSKSFTDWMKFRDGELKIQATIVKALGNVVKAVEGVAKTVAGRR